MGLHKQIRSVHFMIQISSPHPKNTHVMSWSTSYNSPAQLLVGYPARCGAGEPAISLVTSNSLVPCDFSTVLVFCIPWPFVLLQVISHLDSECYQLAQSHRTILLQDLQSKIFTCISTAQGLMQFQASSEQENFQTEQQFSSPAKLDSSSISSCMPNLL